MDLRRAGAADVAAISVCVQRAYARYADRLPVPPKPVLADYVLVVHESEVWLLFDADATHCCVAVLVLQPKSDHLYIDNVAVDPDYQRARPGSTLRAFKASR